ncbi:MAG: hypothetical protein ACYTG0_43490, partial [Planctomycetota bacterium]
PSAKLSSFAKNHRKLARNPPRKSPKNQFRCTAVELRLEVHGALLDHHRLMWQFGAAPLMYYLFGEP